ncbi:MAG: DUF4376 domain-containing protein [Gammaproteobacteria bacterium]|nr:DUF4376 domain-containing protein [Acholeplasmataceae bacterium]MCK9528937.1 DUF4376 domain-containing protein [Gammaproteobacteria bacterium]
MTTENINNAQFIRESDMVWPLSLHQIRKQEKERLLPRNPSREVMESIGYFVIDRTTAPEGDVVTQIQPVKDNGAYKQTWSVRSFNEQELADRLESERANRMSQVKAYRQQVEERGFPYDFGGEYGIIHIQVRDGDRVNLTGLRINAMSDPEYTSFFRVYENIVVPQNAEELIALTSAALTGYTDLLQQVWSIEDAIRAATSIEELPEVPELN